MNDDRHDDDTGSDVSTTSRDSRDSRDMSPEARAERKRLAIKRRIDAAEHKLRVFALRKAGLSFRQIARETGLSVGRCHQIVDGELAVLTEQLTHSREQLRALELERCDVLLVKLDGFLREGRKVEKRVEGGKVVETTVIMRRPAVGYFFAYMRVLERRAKLLGIDAPTKVELTTPKPERELPDDAIDRQIAELQAEVAAAAKRNEERKVH